MEIIRRLKKIRELPAPLLFQVLLDRLSLNTVQIRRFHLLSYSGMTDIGISRGRGQVRRGEPSDVARMAGLEDAGKRKIFEERFAAGDYCVVAVDNEKIAGYEWYSCKSYHIERRYGYVIPIPRDGIYAYDGFILPEYRISGIWIKFQKSIMEHMKELNKARIITLIDSDNALSLKSHVRFGFAVFKNVVLVKIAGRRYFRESIAKPKQKQPHMNIIRG